MFRKLTLLMALAFGLCWSGIMEVLAQDVPDTCLCTGRRKNCISSISMHRLTDYVYVNILPTNLASSFDKELCMINHKR